MYGKFMPMPSVLSALADQPINDKDYSKDGRVKSHNNSTQPRKKIDPKIS